MCLFHVCPRCKNSSPYTKKKGENDLVHFNNKTQYEDPSTQASQNSTTCSAMQSCYETQKLCNPTILEPFMIKTSLVKCARGFGLSIVGGNNGDIPKFFQITAITPHGPAWQDGKLEIGDILIYVNEECVLGFSHEDTVSLFQSIPPGEIVHLGVTRGFKLFNPIGHNTEVVTTNAVSSCNHHNKPNSFCDFMNKDCESVNLRTHSANSTPDPTVLQSQRQRKFEHPSKFGTDNNNHSFNSHDLNHQAPNKADFSSVDIVNRRNGFVFTIAGSVYGPQTVNDLYRLSNFVQSNDPYSQPPVCAGYFGPSDTLYHDHENLSTMPLSKVDNLYPPSSMYSLPGSVLNKQMLSRTPEYIDMTVTLHRQDSGFGFRIVGGIENGSQVAIYCIIPGKAADLDGRLRTGDEIISVDNQLVLNASHYRVVQLIGNTTNGKVTLGIRRRVPSVDSTCHSRSIKSIYPYDVTVTRQKYEIFGFHLSRSNTIGSILKGSPADRCGQLHSGDRILAVNNVSISNMHHHRMRSLLMNSGYSITLTIGPPGDNSYGTTSTSESDEGVDDQYHAIEQRKKTHRRSFKIKGADLQCLLLAGVSCFFLFAAL